MFSCFCRLIRLKEAWIGGTTISESKDVWDLCGGERKVKSIKHKA